MTTTANRRKIGSIDLLDLDIVSRFYGRDSLPYPLMFTQPSRFPWQDDYVEYARSVPDRFNHGDLAVFRECAASYVNADIRVQCHVQYMPADTPSVRVIAARCDQAGVLATQRPDEDVVDVYELSAYLLGPAIADAVALDKPGRRSAIVIPEWAPVSADTDTDADADFTVGHPTQDAPSATEVPRAEVRAYGAVQTHWRPTRHWGIDPRKNAAIWVQITGDGDYLYEPDYSAATPMSRPTLVERIDLLISDDVKALRQFRSG